VWRGIGPADGRGNQSRRLPIQRPSGAPAVDIPYATPFAWGKCGLVLPRYPGTRVVVTHRHGRPDEAIDIGALWESAHGPDSNPGDWWLILPVGVEGDRAAIQGDAPPQEHKQKVTNDLIDGDGNRVIEVGELRIRVGRDSLGNAGERPERPQLQDGVTIEHADGGALITIDKEGNIVIMAKKNLDLISEEGDVNIKASKGKVDVTVQSEMNIH